MKFLRTKKPAGLILALYFCASVGFLLAQVHEGPEKVEPKVEPRVEEGKVTTEPPMAGEGPTEVVTGAPGEEAGELGGVEVPTEVPTITAAPPEESGLRISFEPGELTQEEILQPSDDEFRDLVDRFERTALPGRLSEARLKLFRMARDAKLTKLADRAGELFEALLHKQESMNLAERAQIENETKKMIEEAAALESAADPERKALWKSIGTRLIKFFLDSFTPFVTTGLTSFSVPEIDNAYNSTRKKIAGDVKAKRAELESLRKQVLSDQKITPTELAQRLSEISRGESAVIAQGNTDIARAATAAGFLRQFGPVFA